MDFVIIDIETTGGNFSTGKITEIAIVKHNGISEIDRYQTLINPLVDIPPFITQLTGIDNKLVANAPKFFEVARKIIEFTENCYFVAHNVNFDYGFIQAEFRSLGYEFIRKKLCTVQISRKLFPGKDSYSLGKLCASLSIELKNAHRAMADAEATSKIFVLLYANEKFAEYILDPKKKLLNQANINEELWQKIESIPEKNGVYVFLNAKNEVLFVGKSINIKKRIFNHLFNENSDKAIELKNGFYDVTYTLTDNDFISHLLENELISNNKPKFNKGAKQNNFPYGIISYQNQDSFTKLEIIKTSVKTKAIMAFEDTFTALGQVNILEKKYALCQKINKSEGNQKECTNFNEKLCKGACIGQESYVLYNARVSEALDTLCFTHDSFAVKVVVGNLTYGVFVKEGVYCGFELIASDLETHFKHAAQNMNKTAIFIIRKHIKHYPVFYYSKQ